MPDFIVATRKVDGVGGPVVEILGVADFVAAKAAALARPDVIAAGGVTADYATELLTGHASRLGAATESTMVGMANNMSVFMAEVVVVTNSSITPLVGAASFTPPFESVIGYEGIGVSVSTDQIGGVPSITIDWSKDGVNPILGSRQTFNVTAANGFLQKFPTLGNFVRVKYTNGAINQTSFDQQVKLIPRLFSLGTAVNPIVTSLTGGLGSVTANAGTNLNTSLLALEAGGNLAALRDIAHVINGALVKASAIAGQLDDVATVLATENNVAPVRITPGRALHASIRDNSGNEMSFGFGNNQRLKVGQETQLILDPVKANALNTNIWVQSSLTMTIAQTPGMLTLNSAASVVPSTYAILTSIKQPLQNGDFPLAGRWRAQVKPQANSVIEIGFGAAATVAAPTNGAFLRWDSTGTLKGVINNAGTETLTATLTALDPTKFYEFSIYLFQNRVRFIVELGAVTVIDSTLYCPDTQSSMNTLGTIGAFERVYNTGVAPAVAPQLFLALISVTQLDLNSNKSWELQRTENAKGAYQNVFSPFDQLQNWTNSTPPASATLSNTSAGYTTLGGLFQFAAVVGAATDYALFGFQVPGNLQLIIESLDITCQVTGSNIGATPTLMQWGVGINSSAVSLATAEAPPTSWAPRRIAIGMIGFDTATIIGSSREVVRRFPSPLVVDGGRFFHVILTIFSGLATASQVFRGTVNINGFFE